MKRTLERGLRGHEAAGKEVDWTFVDSKIAVCSFHLWDAVCCVSYYLVGLCVVLRILAWTGRRVATWTMSLPTLGAT